MALTSPRTPVIIGAAVHNDRGDSADPIDLMVAAATAAARDTASSEAASSQPLVRSLDWIRVPWGIWPYADPGQLVATRLGATNARSTKTTVGGNQVYDLLIDTAARLQDGAADLVLICGAENGRSRSAASKRGERFGYADEVEGVAPDEVFGSTRPLTTPHEDAFGLAAPVLFYAMAESVIRHRNGESVPHHRERIARLWADAGDVARTNPDAWIGEPPDAAEIATPSATNRPIAAPYTKFLSSNPSVNQGGAVLMATVEMAQRLGVPRERWVFPWSGVSASDAPFMSNRWAFDESTAIRLAGRRTLKLAGVGIDDCAHLDLYSCFPSAVQVAMRELGIAPDRQWTITGGLTFAAGPLNCYCLLPAARAVNVLRERPDDVAFLTGNGGYLSKHSFVVLSGQPHPSGFRTDSVQAAVDRQPLRPDPPEWSPNNGDGDGDGESSGARVHELEGAIDDVARRTARVEAYTVTYDRQGQAERAIIAALDGEGHRRFVTATDTALLHRLATSDRCGLRLADL